MILCHFSTEEVECVFISKVVCVHCQLDHIWGGHAIFNKRAAWLSSYMHLLITNQNRERIITMQDSEWIFCCCCIRLITIVCVVYVRAYKPGLTFISHTCHYTQHKDQTPPTLLLCICIYYINKAILWVFSLNWSFHFEKYLPVDCCFFLKTESTRKKQKEIEQATTVLQVR